VLSSEVHHINQLNHSSDNYGVEAGIGAKARRRLNAVYGHIDLVRRKGGLRMEE
jgi:hypothetical protein